LKQKDKKMSTKHSITMDDGAYSQAKCKQTKRKNRIHQSEDMIQQYIKEKQLLKQWKAARASGKKTQLIVRKQSRDTSRGEKERFNETDETDYEFCGEPVDRCIFKSCPEYTKHAYYYA